MRNIIAGKIETKSKITKNFTFFDMFIIFIGIVLSALICGIEIAVQGKIAFVFFMLMLVALNVIEIGGRKGYIEIGESFAYLVRRKKTEKVDFSKQKRIQATDVLKVDNTYTAIFEINGIDFHILDGYSQDNVIAVFKDVINEINEGSFIKLEKRVDYSNYVANLDKYKQVLENRDNETGNETLLDVCNIHQVYLDYFSNEAIVKSAFYYFVVKEQTLATLQNISDIIKETLESLGVGVRKLEEEEIIEFLANSMCSNELKTTPELVEKYKTIKINGIEKKIIQVSRYPYMVGNAWLADIFNIPNTQVCFNFKRYGGKDLTKTLNKAIQEAGSNLYTTNSHLSQKKELGKREALDQVSEDIVFLDEKIYDVQTYFMFDSKYKNDVVKKIKASKFMIDYCSGNQKEAYINMQPHQSLASSYKRYNYIQIQAECIASSFPFVQKVLHDKDGMYLGYNNNQIFFDPFERNTMRTNSNLAIIGSSGKGKSFLMKKLILELSCRNVKFFILDPEDEYRELCKNLEGNYIEVAGSSESKINPLQVFPSLKENGNTNCFEDIAQHRLFLKEFFKVIFPALTDEQLIFIDNAISELYSNFKIIDGVNLYSMKNTDFPIFDDLLKIIKEKSQDKKLDSYEQEIYFRLSFQFKSFAKGGLYEANWNGYTTLELNNNFNVLNFRSLFANNNREVANAQMLLVMRFINLELIKNKTYNDRNFAKNKEWQPRHIVEIVDEGHNFINPNYPIALEKMQQTSRQVRKYFGAFWFATQNITDFVGGTDEVKSKASAIIDNCKFSALLGMQQNDLNVLVELYKNSRPFTTAEISQLSKGERGKVLLALDSDTRLTAQIEAFEEEVRYFDYNASIQIEKAREKQKEENEKEQKEFEVEYYNTCVECPYLREKRKTNKTTFYCSRINKKIGLNEKNMNDNYKYEKCPLKK